MRYRSDEDTLNLVTHCKTVLPFLERKAGESSSEARAVTGDVSVTALPEATLIERALQGDHRAFGELVRRYQDAVYNVCYRMLGDPHEAEDASQEVFLRVYRHLHRYDRQRRFSTWVLSIASHYCIDCLRRRQVVWVSWEDVPSQVIAAPTALPEETLVRKESCDKVQQLLEHLAVEDRLVLILHYWHNLSYREIAQVMGLSEGAVKTRAHRARQRLGQLLIQEGWTP